MQVSVLCRTLSRSSYVLWIFMISAETWVYSPHFISHISGKGELCKQKPWAPSGPQSIRPVSATSSDVSVGSCTRGGTTRTQKRQIWYPCCKSHSISPKRITFNILKLVILPYFEICYLEDNHLLWENCISLYASNFQELTEVWPCPGFT